MILHRILLVFDGLIAAILLYFFAAGREDGSVSSFNILIWLVLLAAIGLPIAVALALGARGRVKTANLVLLLPALPGLLFLLFFLMLILLQPNWN